VGRVGGFEGLRVMDLRGYAKCVSINLILMLVVFYVVLNSIGYAWTGQLYPEGSGFRLDFLTGGLENQIPLVPEFVLFYVYLFYPFALITMLFFGFVECRRGHALGLALVFINAIALVVYVALPVSTYWWRQEYLGGQLATGFWADQVYSIWSSDTSFNCFPSLHAAVSTICFYAWHRYRVADPTFAKRLSEAAALFVAFGVILSTLFIKQHYVADEIAGIILALLVGRITFRKLWDGDDPKLNETREV